MIVFLDVIRLDTVTARVRTPSQSPANNYEGIIVMTTTGETARPLPLLGQAVGQAQASLTKLLTGILAGTGTSHRVWLGLQRLNALGGRPAGEVVAAGLAASGDDGSVALSARGRALREEVLAASAQVTGPMLATVARAELDTTIRTLEKITRL